MELFFRSAQVSYMALFTWTRPASYLTAKILTPFSELLFFTLLGSYATGQHTVDFYLIGNALRLTAVNGIYGVSMGVGHERNEGTLIYLIGSPADRIAVFGGRAGFHIVDSLLTSSVALVIGHLWFGLNIQITDLLLLFAVVLTAAMSVCGLGLLLGSFGLTSVNVMFMNNTIYFLLILLSGANIPVEKLPKVMQLISMGLPLTRSITATHMIMAGAHLTEVVPLLLGDLVVGSLYAVGGFYVFSLFEFRARQRGNLEAF